MASKLLIVESPAKARTLKRYLGKQYRIEASVGHIRDLPQRDLAVDIENDFRPNYVVIPEKKKTVEQLRKAAKTASEILLGTDPDREGEAIAWHIAQLLGGNGSIRRVAFNEITKNAVLAAVAHPGEIDARKVDAQQARRVLDRLVGYLVSEQLWSVVAKGLSAGRVQSVALRLVVEREQEVEEFVPEEYWLFHAIASLARIDPFRAKLMKMAGEDVEVDNEQLAGRVVADLETLPARVHELRRRKSAQKPKPPFTTSTMQQEAARRLGMGGKRTMRTAQTLYEGVELGTDTVGLITYMRTDSTRVSPDAIGKARAFIKDAFGDNYLSPKARRYAAKKGKRTQDAHEAIRPTDVRRTPASVKKHLKSDQFRLYELIWTRFVATQMADAVFDGVTVDIAAGERGNPPAGFEKGNPEHPPYLLRAVGRRLHFPGFRKLWGEDKQEEPSRDKYAEEVSELPDALFRNGSRAADGSVKSGDAPVEPKPGDPAEISDVESEQKFTQPPPRYSEATLVKTLDELGIGRPSTYAQIIGTIQDRKYVERDEKQKLKPTELGRTVNRILVGEFDHVFNVKFTAEMEDALDEVEEGRNWTETVRRFWEPFSESIDRFKTRKREIKQSIMEPTGRTCPKCGEGELVERWGRYGKFIACNRFPQCRYIEKPEAVGEARSQPEEVGRKCPECKDGDLLSRTGRNGRFIGCSRYPKCRYTEDIPGEQRPGPKLPDVSIPCPRDGCGGTIVAKRTRRRKIFYSCTNWKKKNCPVAFWDEPVEKTCPNCGYQIMTKKGAEFVCPECKHGQPNPDAPAGSRSRKRSGGKETARKKPGGAKKTSA
ncbi:MAG: DNA topoisomerase 1 [Calditrichaeota bacterium]|nr:DNA topoisomerase 1 [Calditrichota bacterium]